MFREFSCSSITTDAKNKSITLFMTAEIDERTVVGDNLQLLDCSTNSFVIIDYTVDLDKIIITLPRFPVPNSKYTIVLQGVTDIVGNPLKRGINYYNVQFESPILTEVKFVSPTHSEEVDNLIFSLYEYIAEKDLPNKDQIEFTNSFYIEVATDNLFNNIIFTTELIDRNILPVMELRNGQYFARVRVQKLDAYGNWSEVITFVLNSSTPNNKSNVFNNTEQESESDLEPVFYKPLTIVGVPKDGDDINSFFIEFSGEIDPDSFEFIEVYRRMI